MGKFSGILICTDLDGTLFRNDKSISAQNREAIEYFKSEGGAFTFITGRMPYYSLEAYNAARPNVPFGCINGGGVYDGERGRYVWTCDIPREVLELVSCVDARFPNVGIQICGFDRTYFAKENIVMQKFRELTGVPNVVCDYRDFRKPFAKILFGIDNEADMRELAELLHKHPASSDFTLVRSERTLFEILPRGVNKALALGKLAEHLSIDPERTIALGDYDNDVGMLRAAGIGIAVANASRAALEAADMLTVSNEEHAIARVIADLESGAITV